MAEDTQALIRAFVRQEIAQAFLLYEENDKLQATIRRIAQEEIEAHVKRIKLSRGWEAMRPKEVK